MKKIHSKIIPAKRIETGIPGLDSLMGGGFLPGSVNLISGETGTGKTILCSQFLWHGLQKGETGIFVSLEEEPEDIKEDVSQFGWDFDAFIKKGMFNIFYHDPSQASNITSKIINEIGSLNAKRVVIDSTATIGLAIENPSQIRKRLLSIVNTLKKSGCTSIVTSEINEGKKGLSRFGVEEFVVDGVIILSYTSIAQEGFGSIEVRKMRRTAHQHGMYPTKIGKDGLQVGKESIMLMK
ncbi:MAG: ATPase domain-containing protein [Nanoarchaeota archaeon]